MIPTTYRCPHSALRTLHAVLCLALPGSTSSRSHGWPQQQCSALTGSTTSLAPEAVLTHQTLARVQGVRMIWHSPIPQGEHKGCLTRWEDCDEHILGAHGTF